MSRRTDLQTPRRLAQQVPRATFSAVSRLIQLGLARALAAFLALELADTPIFCADERPGETSGIVLSHAAPSSVVLDAATIDSAQSDSATCFCPCHLAFESESPVALLSSEEPRGRAFLLSTADPTATSRPLDHPPQNLG
jgi:hypothetical protein